jgi:rSAM/selenodomain-associated transferase 1
VSATTEAAAVRRGAGLFRLPQRGVLAVEGRDRVRWLDGMLSNDVAGLAPGPERSGCYALLLTRKGRIVADLRVLLRPEALWLELPRGAVAPVAETLGRFIVADDVVLRDASQELERLALEGPAAPEILEAALGAPLPLAAEAGAEVELAGVRLLVAAFGWSGAPARQLFAPAGSGEGVARALAQAGAARGLVEAGAEALEILRIEAGVPRLGTELDEEVLPAEARLAGRCRDPRRGSRCRRGHQRLPLPRGGRHRPGLRAGAPRRPGHPAARGGERGAGDGASLPGRGARMSGRGVLVVFARAPRPGQVKTRMCPPLSPDQAAALYAALLADVLDTTADLCRRLELEPVVTVHPGRACAEIARVAPPTFRVIAQRGATLAARMSWAMREAAACGASPILLRGSDSPLLDAAIVSAALEALRGADLAVSPDPDGGYNLIGVRRPVGGLFDQAMSTSKVLDDTLANARRAGLRSALLPVSFDLDTAEDLRELLRERGPSRAESLCPRTLAMLRTLAPPPRKNPRGP